MLIMELISCYLQGKKQKQKQKQKQKKKKNTCDEYTCT